MRKKKNMDDYCARFIVALCMMLFVYIVSVFVAQNICCEVFGMTNPIVVFLAEAAVDTEDMGKKIEINWQNRYPFNESKSPNNAVSISDRYLDLVEIIESKIDAYVNKLIPCRENMDRMARRLETIIGYDIQLSDDKNDIIYMQNGYLTYPQPKISEENIAEIADALAAFNTFLAGRGIPFFYANVGSKVCPQDRELYVENVEYTNENADVLLSMLEERDVDILDFRKEMLDEGLDWYASYYKTDHHWTTQTGLWAAGIIAEKLNKTYGYSFNKELYKLSEYRQITYDNFWIGAQGRIDGFAKCSLESFTLLLPQFDTDFSISIPTQGLNLRGEYSYSLMEREVIESIKGYSRKDFFSKPDAYYCSRLRNDELARIENHLQTNNEGKKILFLQDSYAWYSTAFLAMDISQIDVIYPKTFDGSICAYIEENKPDMVIMMYGENEIETINWDTHLSFYDLR